MSNDDSSIGRNVRKHRRARGLTLDVLAGLVGHSKGWLSMVENGHIPLEKRSDIAALARELQVAADDIIGEPAGDVDRGTPTLRLVGLREILHEYSIEDPPDVPVRPLAAIAADLREQDAALRDADYATMMRTLPDLLAELHTAAADTREPDRSEALRLLIQVCGLSVIVLRHFGHSDLAWICGERGRQAATALGDPVWSAAAAYGRAHASSSMNLSRALLVTPRIADELEPVIGDDRFAHQVYGMLRLSAALACQVSGDSDGARNHAREAARLAERQGDDPDAWELFGTSNVGVWRTMFAVESGDATGALEISDAVNTSALASNNRRAALSMERARAFAMLDKPNQSMRELRKAERLSPAQVHHSPLIKELVRDMIHAPKKNRDLRGLAWRMGII